MLPKIIAVCGYKRSGKDTIAKYLNKKYNYKHLKITYKLKECLKLLFDLRDHELETDKKEKINKKWNVTPRKLMQFIGTEIFQYKIQEILPNIDKKFWIKTFLTDSLVNNLRNKKDFHIVISDIRFIHEYEELKKLNIPISVIKVTNDNIMIDSNEELHISEREFIKIPYDKEILNNSTFDDMYKKIDEYIININQNK
jgi:dephospho-CoA kinase